MQLAPRARRGGVPLPRELAKRVRDWLLGDVALRFCRMVWGLCERHIWSRLQQEPHPPLHRPPRSLHGPEDPYSPQDGLEFSYSPKMAKLAKLSGPATPGLPQRPRSHCSQHPAGTWATSGHRGVGTSSTAAAPPRIAVRTWREAGFEPILAVVVVVVVVVVVDVVVVS